MGQSSEMMIQEQSRNEAKEVIEILRHVAAEIGTEAMNAEDNGNAMVLDEWGDRIRQAIKLVEKFSEKHQPEIQRWK